MGFDKRESAKNYMPQDNDTLQTIAEREAASGNEITAEEIAKFNWGTDDPAVVDNMLRDELGCYRLGDGDQFVISADCDIRTPLLIPQPFHREGFALNRTHTLRVRKKEPPPPQFEACAQIRGAHFEFRSSFIRPSVVDDLRTVVQTIRANPGGKIMVFGHTDKVGTDGDNKRLGERRARSAYAFITDDPDAWEELYQEEGWGLKVVQAVLKDLGGIYDPGPVDGVYGLRTRAALKNFQYDQGIDDNGENNKTTRVKLFRAYMIGKHDVHLTPDEFMDPKHMGCGEFNPVVYTEARCEDNRRVTFFIFNEERLPRLPCQYFEDNEELTPCRIRLHDHLWPPQFRCSFYNDLARDCACEGGLVGVGPKSLEVVSVDHHFVPGVETVDVVYQLTGYGSSDRVTIEFVSNHYVGGPIFTRDLRDAEKSCGEHTFSWDGRANCESGDLVGRFIHPLLSPFRVRIYDGEGRSGELEFHVLYAHITLSLGPWTPTDDVPARSNRQTHWVQLRLNELGFFAGPVDGSSGAITQAAIKTYKRYHRNLFTDTTRNITNDLCNCLQAGDNARQIFSSNDWIDISHTERVYLDCDVYYRQYNDLLNPSIKCDHERDMLSRPCFPLQAKVLLLSKNHELGSGEGHISSPEAVGPVKVRWIMEDQAEDMNRLPDGSVATVPSRTRQYVRLALAVVGPPGDNCPTQFRGLRPMGAVDHRPVYVNGSQGLLPFTAVEDAGNRAYFTRAHTDPENHAGLRGHAMIIARPSYLSGDSYRFGAMLDFSGEVNQAYLVGVYTTPVQTLTGVLEVWRRTRVGAYVAWAQRNETNEGLSWANVHARFEEAYIDLATPAATLNRNAFMTLNDYSAIVTAICTNAAYVTSVQNEATELDLNNYAVDFRTARLPGETNAAYGQRIGNAAAGIWDQISTAVVNRLSAQLRPQAPLGLLVLDFKAICPTQWRAATGSVGDVPAGRSAWADRNGVTMIEVDINMNQDTLMTHEIGHNFYLSHWEVPAGDLYRRPIDHDQNDHNCMMSYAWNLANRTDGVNANGQLFDGRFCGKCNIKLRGWNLSGGGLPNGS